MLCVRPFSAVFLFFLGMKTPAIQVEILEMKLNQLITARVVRMVEAVEERKVRNFMNERRLKLQEKTFLET